MLEVISAYVDPEGGLTVLRGQRRTLVASKVGTPSGTVPVRVVALAQEADRIIDQASENLHRADITERETRDAVEQLALLGVSAAQITKQMALPRPAVNRVLAVVANPATKERMDAAGMTLQDAALFAEFEDDPDAIVTLTEAWQDRWRRTRLPHVAQQLRDARVEAQALQAEVERLRGEGLPVLDPRQVPGDLTRHTLANLRTGDGQPVPREQWSTIAGAAVVVTVEWVEPEDDDESDADPGEPEQAYVPVWVCTDPQAAGLHDKYSLPSTESAGSDGGDDSDEARVARAAEVEARREADAAERRRVIANKEWRSAEVVRREWLGRFLTRRTVPAGAEALIARALIGREHSLSQALQNGHALLPDLLGVKPAPDESTPSYYANRTACARIIEQSTTAKAATVRTLAAVLAAWEQRSGTHTWRNPTSWDADVMSALIGWGYPASDVEQLLVPTADDNT